MTTCQKCGCTKPCRCDNYTKEEATTCQKCGCTKPCRCDNYTEEGKENDYK